jgi:MATE family multidrug resistance protein
LRLLDHHPELPRKLRQELKGARYQMASFPFEAILAPMTRRSPFPRRQLGAMLKLALPLAAANMLQMAVYAIDVIFVARLGQSQLAASSLAVSLFGLLAWSFSGLTGAVAPIMAAELGRRRHAVREIRRSVRMGLWLSVACGLIGMVCMAGTRLYLASGQSAQLAAHAALWAF